MRIKCIGNQENRNNNLDCWYERNKEKVFNVYGIYKLNGDMQFCISEDSYGYTAILVDATKFKIIDNSLYNGWILDIDKEKSVNLIIKEWTEFIDHLYFFNSPWEFEEREDYMDYLYKLESFHRWVELIDSNIC